MNAVPPDKEQTPDGPQRLSKVVAALVRCSRREAEKYITQGRVSVDGRQVEEPQFRVAVTQRVETREEVEPTDGIRESPALLGDRYDDTVVERGERTERP